MVDRYKVVVGNVTATAHGAAHPEGEYVLWRDYEALRARVAELEAAVTRYRQYEYVEAQHDETGRSWFGARYNIPTRFHEVSNESGEPGPTARAAVNKSAQRIEVPK